MECLGRYTFLVMTSVILSGGMKRRDEHVMLREVYIFCHDFCHTFRSSMECLGRYTFALRFFFAASFTASFAAFREALSFAAHLQLSGHGKVPLCFLSLSVPLCLLPAQKGPADCTQVLPSFRLEPALLCKLALFAE